MIPNFCTAIGNIIAVIGLQNRWKRVAFPLIFIVFGEPYNIKVLIVIYNIYYVIVVRQNKTLNLIPAFSLNVTNKIKYARYYD